MECLYKEIIANWAAFLKALLANKENFLKQLYL